MFIEFQELELSNFLSYGKSPTIINLNTHPTTLLLGESGSGKSSIPNALSFCLFDDTFRGVQKAQLINSDNGKNCYVKTKFRIGSDKYEIKRGIKPNVLEVTKNGNALGRDSKVNDLQSHIEQNILKFDKKTFNQIVSLAEVNFVPFMLLPAKDRRTFVEKVLGVEIFSVMNALLKVRAKETADSCDSMELKTRNIEEKVNIHQEYIEKAKKENKEKLEEHKSEIKTLEDKKKKIESKVQELKENELQPLLSQLEKFQEIQDQLAEVELKLKKIEITTNNEKKKRKNIEEGDTCLSCGQKLPKEKIQTQLQEIDEKLETLQQQTEKGEKVKQELEKKKSKFKLDNEKLEEVKDKINEGEIKIRQCVDQIKFHQKEMQKYESGKATNVKEILTEIKQLEEEKENIQEQLSELYKQKEINQVALQLLKDDGIKAEIIRSYIPKINLYVNRFLENMGYDVSFHLNHEFEEQIRTRGKESFSYNSFSAGQRQRIDLALLFTWRAIAKSRNSVSTNLLFLDEVVDSHLNVESTESVIDMFQGELFKGINVFVISHKRDIATKFRKVINFELRNGFTQVSQ